MRSVAAAVLTLALTGPGAAQQISNDLTSIFGESDNEASLEMTDIPGGILNEIITEELTMRADTAEGAVIRALDRVSGQTRDFELASGQQDRFGRIALALGECRYPADNPEGDAFAYVAVTLDGQSDPAFAGWMVASSPALSALDHPRYDVWVLRCMTASDDG